MFGYVMPLKAELKIKDYEKFKAYYCGLCIAIKKKYGNLPRMILNYDMTFLGILLDSLEDEECNLTFSRCVAHPFVKRPKIISNKALEYAAFFNVTLAYFKLKDDAFDDNSLISGLSSNFLKLYFNKTEESLMPISELIESKLKELYTLEKNCNNISIDELTEPFATLTGKILSSFNKDEKINANLYNLGYNLGKWIYIIDAYDDLYDDMKHNKFNAINKIFNKDNIEYTQFKNIIEGRIDFILVTSARNCFESLTKLPLKTNKDLLYNILQLGLLEKMDNVFGRNINEKSI
jgi:hypothetical protein